MSLPDQLERVGIVVGSSILVALPVNLLLAVFARPDQVWPAGFLGFGVGAVVGVLVATGLLAITYREVWLFSILAWLATTALWWAFTVKTPAKRQGLAVATWLVAVGFAALATQRWPTIDTIYRRS